MSMQADAIKIAEVLMGYLEDQMIEPFHEFEGKEIAGWRWLPRICFSIFSANTFFYTCVVE